MRDPLVPLPLRKDREYFVGILERLLAAGGVRAVSMGGCVPVEQQPGDGREVVLPYPRLLLVTQGVQRFALSERGQRVDHVLRPRDAWYTPPHGWTMDFWDHVVVAVGLVFRTHFLRVLAYHHRPGQPLTHPGTPFAYHTVRPLAGAGHGVLAALNELADTALASAAARDLVNALLHLSLDHLRADQPHAVDTVSRSARTWQRVLDYLHDHYREPIGRAEVAAALGLHPNYLSVLARQQTAGGFQGALQAIRLDAAKRLLRETDLKLDRIAELSGYRSGAYFGTAFRRATGRAPGQYRDEAPPTRV